MKSGLSFFSYVKNYFCGTKNYPDLLKLLWNKIKRIFLHRKTFVWIKQTSFLSLQHIKRFFALEKNDILKTFLHPENILVDRNKIFLDQPKNLVVIWFTKFFIDSITEFFLCHQILFVRKRFSWIKQVYQLINQIWLISLNLVQINQRSWFI